MPAENSEPPLLGAMISRECRRQSLTTAEFIRRIAEAAEQDGRQAAPDRQSVYRWRHGRKTPNADTARWIAVALDQPVELVVEAAERQRAARDRDGAGEDVNRRGFLQFGAAASATLVETLDAGRGELGLALGAGRIGRRRLERLEHTAERYARLYPTSTPMEIGPGIRGHYQAASFALKQDQPDQHRSRLLVAAGWLAALMSWLCFDTNRQGSALDYLDEGLEAASQAGARVLGGYLIASQNRIASFEGDHKEIRDVGRAAIDMAGMGSDVSARMLAWFYTLEARGYAGLGDVVGTERALAKAEGMISEDGRTAHGPEMEFFDPVRFKEFVGECYLFLRKPRLARPHLEETLRLLAPGQLKLRAMAEMDLARAYVQAGQASDGRTLARRALALGDGAFIGPLAQRARDLKAELAALQ